MSDTLTAPVAESTPAPTPEQTPAAPAVVLNADGVPGPTTQGNPSTDEARRALYEKHYGTVPAPTEVAPVTPAAPATPAAEPVVATPPAAPAIPPEFMEALRSFQAELAAIKAQTASPTPPPAPPAPEAEAPFVALLREGKVNEATAALAAEVAKLNQTQIVDQAVARAREVARAEADIESFVKDLKTANPELLIMESMVTADAQQRLAAVQASGKIKTTEDAVREYKKAVLDATESARKIAQSLRGEGKTEAMVRNREVLAASTPTPNQLNPRQPAAPEPQEPVVESPESYLEMRKQLSARNQNRIV